VDEEVQVYSKFSKNKIWKKVKSPNSMRSGRLTLPSVGGSLKEWVYCALILPKCQEVPQNSKKKKSKKSKKFENSDAAVGQAHGSRPPVGDQ
jgi:hypothetical protein